MSKHTPPLPDVGKVKADDEAEEVVQPRGSARRRVLADGMYPTNPTAIARLKRRDSVPFDECGWARLTAGTTVDVGGLDAFIVASLVSNGIIEGGA